MSIIESAAMVMYKDGLNCSEEETKALVVFVEKMIFNSFDKAEDFEYDYDYFTAIEYLKRLTNKTVHEGQNKTSANKSTQGELHG